MSAFHAFDSERPYALSLVLRKQYAYDLIVVPCFMNSAISTTFQSQKTVVINFLAGKHRLYKNFRLVW
jgi:hypothetical protein